MAHLLWLWLQYVLRHLTISLITLSTILLFDLRIGENIGFILNFFHLFILKIKMNNKNYSLFILHLLELNLNGSRWCQWTQCCTCIILSCSYKKFVYIIFGCYTYLKIVCQLVCKVQTAYLFFYIIEYEEKAVKI